MTLDGGAGSRPLSPELAGLIDEACDRFEADWKEGRAPRIEDYLAGAEGSGAMALLRELLALELELRGRRGETPEPHDYLPRFPDHATLIDSLFDAATSTIRGDPTPAPGLRASPGRADWPALADYEILGVLGRGGMGVVYKARQVRLNRVCAVKMILGGAHATAVSRIRFLSEAEIVARLRHPNIVQIYSLGDHDGRPYVELEFVEGGSLADRLDGTPWAPLGAARLVETASLAIDAAHRQGVVHRDLKPANVLLAADGSPKISDFGLAKTLDSDSSLTQSGAILGSPSYMAPEQAAGGARDAGPSADVYALGAILYELLTGRPPFKAATVLLTLEQVKHAEPVPPSRLQPELPRDLETIALKCLQKEPGKRYDSASALAEDLRRFRSGEPILARRVGAAERAWRWCRRNPALAGLAATVWALLVAAAVGSTAAAFRLDQAARRQRELTADAIDARRRAEEQAGESRRRLVQLNLAQALRLIDDGDLAGSLPWLIEAMRRDVEARGPSAESIHRERLAMVLGRHPRLTRLWSHPGKAVSVAFSPDGRRLAVAAEDRAVRIWDVATGAALGSWQLGHRPGPVAFSPDGRRVVTATARSDNEARPEVRLWDAESGLPIVDPMGQDLRVYHVAFSPDGRRLAVALGEYGADPARSKGEARLLDTATGRRLGAPLPTGRPALFVAFSPDGRRLATSALGDVRVWDAETSRPLTPALRHGGFVEYVAFSGDGGRLLTSCFGGWARVWDAGTGEAVSPRLVHGGGTLPDTRFSPDGRRVVTASSDQTARIWDVETGRPLTPPLPHEGPVLQVGFSADGRRLLTTSWDRTARLWDVETGRPTVPPLRHTAPVLQAGFDPDERVLTTACADGTVRSWDLASGPTVPPLTHGGPIITAVFSPDGRRAATASHDGTGRVWDAETGQPVTRPLRHGGRWVVDVAFSPDGRRVATAGLDGTARIWDAETGRPALPPIAHPDRVGRVLFSADGRRLLTLDGDSEATIWDPTTGRRAGPSVRHKGALTDVLFAPDGRRFVTAGDDGEVRTFDAEDAREVGPTVRMDDGVDVVAFRPDGRWLLTVGLGRSVEIWDAATGRPVAPPLLHDDLIAGARFSPDGLRVVTAGTDRSARVWDAASGRPLTRPMVQPGSVMQAAFSPDGRRVASAGTDGTLRVWDAGTGQPLSPPLRHQGVIKSLVFSPDGRRILTASQDGTAETWDLTRPPFEPSNPDLPELARLVAGREVDTGGDLAVLGPEDVVTLAESLRRDCPDAFVTPPAEVAAWHWREALDCERRQLGARALAHRQAALAIRVDSWQGHWDRARSLLALGRLDEAAEALGRVVALRPDDDQAWAEARVLHARLRHWPEAAAVYARRVRPDPPRDDWFEQLAIALLGGDTDGYRRRVVAAAEHSGASKDAVTAYTLARAAALAPGSVVEPRRPVRWAEQAVAARRPSRPAALHALALAHYRAGQYERAIRRADESIASNPKWSGNVLNRLVAGLAHHRLGREAEARLRLGEVRPDYDRALRGTIPVAANSAAALHPSSVLELLVLGREAGPLLDRGLADLPEDVFAPAPSAASGGPVAAGQDPGE